MMLRALWKLKRKTVIFNEKYIYATMKKHILNYLKNFNGATKLKQQVCLVDSLDEMLDIIRENI